MAAPPASLALEESAIASLARWYCREAGVRSLQQHIERIYRKVLDEAPEEFFKSLGPAGRANVEVRLNIVLQEKQVGHKLIESREELLSTLRLETDPEKRAKAAEAALTGQAFREEAVRAAAAALDEDFTPLSDHRGSAWYRGALARNLLLGFFLECRSGAAPPLEARPTGTVSGGMR